MDEVKRFDEEGKHVPELDKKVDNLKHFIKDIMDNDEVDPRNEWSIKAHQLLAWASSSFDPPSTLFYFLKV